MIWTECRILFSWSHSLKWEITVFVHCRNAVQTWKQFFLSMRKRKQLRYSNLVEFFFSMSFFFGQILCYKLRQFFDFSYLKKKTTQNSLNICSKMAQTFELWFSGWKNPTTWSGFNLVTFSHFAFFQLTYHRSDWY